MSTLSAPTAMTLSALVAQDKWQDFDDAWTALIGTDAPIEDLLEALRTAAEKKRIPRCIQHVRLHAEALGAAGRAEEATRLLGLVLATGASAGELAPLLYEQAQKAWGEEPWFAAYAEISGLKEGAGDARRAWISFERLLAFKKGQVVYHAGGWGVGEILDTHPDALEITVRFHTGKKDRFPLAGAAEIFEALSEDDLRAMHLRDPDALRKKVREEPLEVLRSVLVRHGGKASVASIKNALAQVGIDGSAWTAWFRKVRKLCDNSEWFKVIGTQSRGEVHLLRTAMDPASDLRRQLEGHIHLDAMLSHVRNQLLTKPDERLCTMMLDVVEKRAAKGKDPLPARVAAWMLLRDQRGETPPQLLEAAREIAAEPPPADSLQPPPLWALFQSISGLKEQERCVALVQEAFGEAWPDEALRNLHHASPGMVRALLDALSAAGRKTDLAALYTDLLARPLRAPEVLVGLARLAEAGRLEGDLPPPVQRAQALLSLATDLYVARDLRGDTAAARTKLKLTDLLTKGKDPLLARLLEGADAESLTSCQRTIQRGVDEQVEHIVSDLVSQAVTASGEGGAGEFWNSDRIWTTKHGLEKRSAELKHLRDVKIPANQDAIGRAAAQGDLSENAEWEAAIEEQRTLTSRAMEMEAELRLADLIENAILAENTVSPGTQVRYREQGEDGVKTIVILGPWDNDLGDNVVSYRAPLAQGLLGRSPGERIRVVLPSGNIDVEILDVKPFQLDHA